MSEIYNKEYYHNGCGPIPYEEPEHWVQFFGMIADRIVADLNPKTVLDAGCAMGYLVSALRDRGVEAYGVDISDYAISMVREDIKPYCRVGSLTEKLTEELPQHFDLVVTIEVLEHLYAEDGKKMIANLCSLADTILFSSTPDDFEERTHVNVQQREYWARLFFEQGFIDDLNYRPTYLTYHASLFRRSNNVMRMVEDYERNIRMSEHEYNKKIAEWQGAVNDKEVHIKNLEGQISENQNAMQELLSQYDVATKKWDSEKVDFQSSLDEITALLQSEQKNAAEQLIQEREKQKQELEIRQAAYDQMCKELDHYKEHYHAAIAQREDLKQQLVQAQNAYNVISNAFFWKITKPLRVIVDVIKRPLRKIRFFRLINKGVRCWKENGFRYTWKKVKNKIKHRQEFSKVAKKPLFTEQELDAQRREVFSKNIKFSIVVPLFNTPDKFLHEMIQSVVDQTYSNWELCMADGSDCSYDVAMNICQQVMKNDSRIKYKRLPQNRGIAGNTIAAYSLATGDFIVLMDHDDMLTKNALFECAKCIEQFPDVDFIYSDKGIFEDKTNEVLAYHYLPDYSPDYLRATNYASHLNAFSKKVIEKVGFIREGYDGSQDYDLELRVVECARLIKHIPKVLYYCRACEGSVALNPESKMYAYESGRRAIDEHLKRIGYPGNVEFIKNTFSYRIHYEIIHPGKVSIIIPNKDHVEYLAVCIESILGKTDYSDYEIIIVENNSENPETFKYYQTIGQNKRVKILNYGRDCEFNYSAINNYAVKQTDSRYVLFLNNDIKVINSNWLTEMVMFAQREDVGAVGAKLYYSNDTYQHIGLFIGLGGHIASHYAHGESKNNTGYMHRLAMPQNYNALTAACLLLKREDFFAVSGFDELNFKVALNDVDLCLKLRALGKYNVLTPFAELYHYESISRQKDNFGQNKFRFSVEQDAFRKKWSNYFEQCDEYYNSNLL